MAGAQNAIAALTGARARNIPIRDGELRLYPSLFSAAESDAFFDALKSEVDWKLESARLYGRTVPMPRLVAWFGDPGTVYRYSGIEAVPRPWTPLLRTIKSRVDCASGATFNSVLLNRYRDERDSVSWHSDDEPDLGRNPIIASVSFGAVRTFQFRHKTDQSRRERIELPHGSLLLMAGATQHHWEHQIPKRSRRIGERINLTFRTIRKSAE